MPKICTYADMSVEILQATENPAAQVGIAMGITMRQDDTKISPPVSKEKCQFLIDAEHTSLFEHVHYTFLIQGVSRSFLGQITRQRSAHPTSGSQHYQDYSDYPCSIHPMFLNTGLQEQRHMVHMSLIESVDAYTELTKRGIAKEEARQVLPNATTVNYLWTIDARNLMFFLRQRCCNRNVYEMRVFANRVLSLVKEHFPQLYSNVGPQCFMDAHFSQESKGCRQGKMQCENKYWRQVG